MTDTRELNRAETFQSRLLAKSAACKTAGAVCASVESVVSKTRLLLADESFTKVLWSQGIRTLPQFLTTNVCSTNGGEDQKSENDRLDEVSLEFAIAWTFLCPLLANPAIAIHLEKKWPGFIPELKDAFITLVVEGPFPPAMSGHSGRRHGARYHSGRRRRSESP